MCSNWKLVKRKLLLNHFIKLICVKFGRDMMPYLVWGRGEGGVVDGPDRVGGARPKSQVQVHSKSRDSFSWIGPIETVRMHNDCSSGIFQLKCLQYDWARECPDPKKCSANNLSIDFLKSNPRGQRILYRWENCTKFEITKNQDYTFRF